jgi:hypothetical protein
MPPKKPAADKGPSKKTELKKKEKIIEVRSTKIQRILGEKPHSAQSSFTMKTLMAMIYSFRIKLSASKIKKVRRTKSS